MVAVSCIFQCSVAPRIFRDFREYHSKLCHILNAAFPEIYTSSISDPTTEEDETETNDVIMTSYFDVAEVLRVT